VDVGLFYNYKLAVDADFGLGPDAYVFVGYDHFWEPDLHPFLLPRERIEQVYRASHMSNGYRMDHGRLVVEGLGHDRMAILTHHEVKVERDIHEVRAPERHGPDEHKDHDDHHP
jgi:hypothetical protein